MEQVKVSPKFQIVIPKEVRSALNIKSGQILQVVRYGNRIELIPQRDISEMKGFLKGIDTSFKRDPDRL